MQGAQQFNPSHPQLIPTMNPTIANNPCALFWAPFNRFELRLPAQAVLDIAQPGPNDDAVAYWAPRINRYEFGTGHAWAPTPDAIRAELQEYGAWDADELADDEANWRRVVWTAAHNVAESDEPDCSEPMTATQAATA